VKKIVLLFATLAVAFGCSSDFFPQEPKFDSVCILYLDGYNNLAGDLMANLSTLGKNALPMKDSREAVVAILHTTASYGDYYTKTSPLMLHLYSDWNGKARADTVKVYEKGSILASEEFLRNALLDSKTMFPALHYGALFSSHGTGWLPEMYYSHPKSFGCGAYYEGTALKSHEIEMPALANAIPYHLDYIVFDACLMGCVEVAYQLREKVSQIMSSQTEVLTGGFDYKTLTQYLLKEYPANVVEYAKKYMEKYKSSSATISVVECSELDGLASVCKELFNKYREPMSELSAGDVQNFSKPSYPWFFDLRDIIVKCKASDEDLAKLDAALARCVLYSDHTAYFQSIKINTDCGFSMFLPSEGSNWLQGYYSTLDWNKATNLVN